MNTQEISRRGFLRLSGLTVAGTFMAACQSKDLEVFMSSINQQTDVLSDLNEACMNTSKEMFIAPLELNPSVKGEDLEQFWVEVYLPNVSELPGYKVTLHKGTEGKRTDKYLYIGHFERSERVRDLFPIPGDPNGSEEWQYWVEDNPVWQELMSHFDFESIFESTHYMDLDDACVVNTSKEMFIAPLELNPDLKGEDLERFWVEAYLPNISELPGYKITLHKGTEGKRTDKYLYIGHFESSERVRDLFPIPGDPNGSAEWQQWVEANPVWQELIGHFDFDSIFEYTHYMDLAG